MATIDLTEIYKDEIKKVKKVEQGEENKIITLWYWTTSASGTPALQPINITGIGEAKFEQSGAIRLRVVNTNIWGGFLSPIYVLAVYPSPGYY